MRAYSAVFGRITNIILLLICFYIIGCCGFDILPAFGSSINYARINSTLLSLSIGYLTGYIIYLFTAILPRKKREAEVLEMWGQPLISIFSKIDKVISVLLAYNGIQKEKMYSICKEDCNNLIHVDYSSPESRICSDLLRDGVFLHRIGEPFNYPNSITNLCSSIKTSIAYLLDSPLSHSANMSLVDTLYRIKESKLIRCYTSLPPQHSVTSFGASINQFTLSDAPECLIDFINLYKDFSRFPTTKETFYCRVLTPEEIKDSEKRITEALNRVFSQYKEKEIVISNGQE